MTKRILFTGGGSGGHVFPLLAVADEFKKMNYSDIELFYLGPKSSLNQEFADRGIPIYRIVSSKLRRYFSLMNFIDVPKFFLSLFQALYRLYVLMPDVVFSKGGTSAFPVVLAARFYMIPIVIHESDSVPGLQNRLSSKFAKRIGLAFESAAAYFNESKVFVSGNPMRTSLMENVAPISAAKTNLGFKGEEPLIFIWGGSQGAERINQFVFNNLDVLLKNFQILHQVGEKNLKEAQAAAQSLSADFRKRYEFAGFMDASGVKSALSASDVVLARAGSGSIFEIAALGKPSILVPLEESANNHQKTNAYDFAKNGAAVVLEEANLKPNIVSAQVENILKDKNKYESMAIAARKFAKPEAAKIIAGELMKLI
jgi:UDP-N-acetylglucosamine--N-acetylmuramyl-(pentapeptide) pyrophosphoryl-undecaprenol N-acetylglucosamine transferase